MRMLMLMLALPLARISFHFIQLFIHTYAYTHAYITVKVLNLLLVCSHAAYICFSHGLCSDSEGNGSHCGSLAAHSFIMYVCVCVAIKMAFVLHFSSSLALWLATTIMNNSHCSLMVPTAVANCGRGLLCTHIYGKIYAYMYIYHFANYGGGQLRQ